jgi:hypothetical protein
VTRRGPIDDATVGAAVIAARALGSEGGVSALRAAAYEGLDGVAVVLAGWELLRRESGVSMDVRLRPARWRDLRDAIDLADRWAGERGAGAVLFLSLMQSAAWEDWRPGPYKSQHAEVADALNAAAEGQAVVSLAHFICRVQQEARRWRRHWRERTDRAGRKLRSPKPRRRRARRQAARGGDAA